MINWQNGANFLFLISVALLWWYVPERVSNYYALRARVEPDPAKREELLKWAISWGGRSNLQLELLWTILQIVEESKNPHQRLRLAAEAEKFAEGLLRNCPTESPDFIELKRLVAEVKKRKQLAQAVSNATAKAQREKFAVLKN